MPHTVAVDWPRLTRPMARFLKGPAQRSNSRREGLNESCATPAFFGTKPQDFDDAQVR